MKPPRQKRAPVCLVKQDMGKFVDQRFPQPFAPFPPGAGPEHYPVRAFQGRGNPPLGNLTAGESVKSSITPGANNFYAGQAAGTFRTDLFKYPGTGFFQIGYLQPRQYAANGNVSGKRQ
jgi:hypothetical protein